MPHSAATAWNRRLLRWDSPHRFNMKSVSTGISSEENSEDRNMPQRIPAALRFSSDR